MTSLISTLLRCFAGRVPDQGAPSLSAAAANASAAELEWAFAAGLGPLLRASLGTAGSALPPALAERLLAADLTARVLIEQRVLTALDAVDACERRGHPVTLLKGISLSHYQYESPHFRPMTDVDVLVPEEAVAELESDLLERDYRHAAPVMAPDSHHGEPLYHSSTHTKLELHSALFPRRSPLRTGTLFDGPTLARESIEARFHGRTVRRLSREFQLVYLASAWSRDLCDQSLDPSFVFGLFDAVALTRSPFDWDRVLELVDNPLAAASLDVLLACLSQLHGALVPSRVRDGVRRRHRLLGAAEVALLRSLVRRSLLGGRRFEFCNSWRIWSSLFSTDGRPGLKLLRLPSHVAFPPQDPRRFDVTMQWARLRRWATKEARSPGS
jgi:hypothetical protein